MGAANIFTFGIAPQTGKGVPATAPVLIGKATGAGLKPVQTSARIDETGDGRDGGSRYTQRIASEGSLNIVARQRMSQMFLYGVLGGKADSGLAPDFTHVNSPTDAQPFFTVWRNLGGAGLVEEFHDVKFTSGTVQGSAGGLIMLNTNVQGLKARRLAAMPVGGVLDNTLPFRVPGIEYQVRGARNRAISEFNLTINTPMTAVQTDEIYDSFLEEGLRTIDLTYTEVFKDLALYNEILYGGPAGTELSENILHGPWRFTTPLAFLNPSMRIEIPNLAYMQAPLEPSPGGDPLRLAVTGAADPPDGGGNILTATIKNGEATF